MHLRRTSILGTLTLLVGLLTPSPALAATAGDLDTTFSGDGIARFGGGAVLIDARGRIIVGSGSTLYRYTPNGSLDRRFSGDGMMSLPVGVSDLQWRNGKILVFSGTALLQVTPRRGRIDPTYGGGDGVVQLPEVAAAIAADPSGVVYAFSKSEWSDPEPDARLRKVVGETIVETVEIPRFTGGWDPEHPDYYGDGFGDIAITADGSSIYVVGYGPSPYGGPLNRVAAVMRYRTSDLTPAWKTPTYGPDDIFWQYEGDLATTIARNNKLIVMGDGWAEDDISSGETSVILRVATDGTVEMTSGLTGWDRSVSDGAGYDLRWGREIFMQDAKIVVVGQTADQTANDLDRAWTVWRMTAQGAPDPDFGGGDGIVRTLQLEVSSTLWRNPSDGAAWDGKIVVVGTRTVRYLAP